ncbi:MAG: hypothetical protein GXC75_11090 [Xanthomonadaceae bacterium]|nr:hypothetical protein [Xanthomonadaceae bacterium]
MSEERKEKLEEISFEAPDPLGARAEELRHVGWAIDASVRYHERRQAFYERTDSLVNALNLIIGSGAVLAIIQSAPSWVVVVSSATVAILSLINLTMRSSAMASLHAQLKQRYIGVLIRLEKLEGPKVSEESFRKELRRLREARLLIEVEEPTIFRVVHVLAHNELLMAQGYDNSHMWHVPWYKALSANWIRWDTSKLAKRSK